uniref:hypothetical protein n=1 Tax=Alistipes onderdonkii TaxID=328813 RepID=UPI003FEE10F0
RLSQRGWKASDGKNTADRQKGRAEGTGNREQGTGNRKQKTRLKNEQRKYHKTNGRNRGGKTGGSFPAK